MSTPRIIVQAQQFVTRILARGLRGERGQGVIPGGTQGQILGKRSDDDYDTEWLNPGAAPSLVNTVAATAPITSTGGVNPVIGINPATALASGSMSFADKAKLDALLQSSAPPAISASSSAGASTKAAREDHTHAHGSQDGGSLHSNASAGTGGQAGFMSSADKGKLDGIAAGAQVNVGTNLGIGGTGNARQVTSSTGAAATLPIATQVNAGVMSTEDKTKLDGISPGATVYTNAIARGQVEAMLIAGANVTFALAGTGATRTLTINATGSGGVGGSGTVTSVDVTFPSIFTASGGPITTAGTIAASLATQPANLVFAGPATGSDAQPTFRSIVADDVPSLPAGKVAPPGSDTQVIFNDGGASGAHSGLAYAKAAQVLSVGGSVIVAGTASVLGGTSGGTFSAGLRTESSGGFASVGLASNSTFGIAHTAQFTADSSAVGVNSAEMRRLGVAAGADAPFFFDGSANQDLWHEGNLTPVTSVNTRAGAVTLTDADVPADVLEVTGTTKTLALTDRGLYQYWTATGAKTLTVDTVTGAEAGEYHIRNSAASDDLTITASGVTISAPKGGTLVLEPGDTVTLKRVASNVFHLFGSTKAA